MTLETDRWGRLTVPAACANIRRAIPGEEVGFAVRAAPRQRALERLMPVLAGADRDVVQAAVWIVTDNASYSDLGVLTAGAWGPRVIGAREAVAALRFCEEAGVDVRRRAIWRDRRRMAQELEDGDLKAWLLGS